MVAEDAGAQADGVPGGDGTVGPYLQGQLVEVGQVADTGVFHRVIDLPHRRVNGVHRDQTDDGLGRLVPVGGDIAPAMRQGQLHVEAGVRSQGGNVEVRIEDLHLAVGLDVAGGDFALTAGFNIDRFHALGVELGNDALHVEDDLGDVLLHSGNGGKLVLHAGDLNGGNRRAGQGREQDAAQGVTQRGTIATLQGLHDVFAVGAVAGVLHTFDAGLLDFYHVLPSFSRRRTLSAALYSSPIIEGTSTITWSTARR